MVHRVTQSQTQLRNVHACSTSTMPPSAVLHPQIQPVLYHLCMVVSTTEKSYVRTHTIQAYVAQRSDVSLKLLSNCLIIIVLSND